MYLLPVGVVAKQRRPVIAHTLPVHICSPRREKGWLSSRPVSAVPRGRPTDSPGAGRANSVSQSETALWAGPRGQLQHVPRGGAVLVHSRESLHSTSYASSWWGAPHDALLFGFDSPAPLQTLYLHLCEVCACCGRVGGGWPEAECCTPACSTATAPYKNSGPIIHRQHHPQ